MGALRLVGLPAGCAFHGPYTSPVKSSCAERGEEECQQEKEGRHGFSLVFLEVGGRPIVAASRLKAGCGQDCPPHEPQIPLARKPPSTGSAAPVTKLEASLARNIAIPTSS